MNSLIFNAFHARFLIPMTVTPRTFGIKIHELLKNVKFYFGDELKPHKSGQD